MKLPQLPVVTALSALKRALQAGHAVLTAPPGSGKTTVVPLALLAEPWLAGQKILMLEPRRPAARMAARRLAQLAGGEPGGLVGYQVRLDRRIGPDTRVEVITEGILTRRLQSDPSLEGVGLVIFDEFHERNLQADLGLALSLDVCAGLREDLRLLVMSATLDPSPLCKLLPAAHVAAAGSQYPVEIRYLPAQDQREPLAAMPSLLRQALAETAGDVLAFLPGRGEIERLAEQLSPNCEAQGIALQRLYGDLPAKEQDRILSPSSGGGRRLILSTDLAESSVTIEGVTAVVDSGLSRKPAFDPNSGMTRLQRLPVSVASADQRAGRAGRLGPGVCYRAWSEARQRRLLPATPPEIATSDLSGLVLELALWGVGEPAQLPWLDMPPLAHWQQALTLLAELGAVAVDGQLTAAGRRMAQSGLEPRLARLLVAAETEQEAVLACDLAALLSERDLFSGRGERAADLGLRLQALQEWRESGRTPGGVDKRRLQAVDQLSRSLRRQTGAAGGGVAREAGELLSLAFPDRIARARPGGRGRFLLANGRGALLDEADSLAGQDWLVVAALDAGQREGRIWSALAASQAGLERVQATHIAESDELSWDNARQGVVARRVKRLGAIVLAEQTARPTDLAAAQAVLIEALVRLWPEGLPWTKPARQLQARMMRMAEVDPEGGWPDMSDRALREDMAEWLGPWLGERLRLSQLADLDLVSILKGRLDWTQQQRLDAWLPTHYDTPAGSHRAIDYQLDGPPRVAVPLQEVFGQAATPMLADGRLPLVLELLNPAGRPLQVTADLANFWSNAYVEVRKELRGRYPRHDWPEDPAATVARRGTGRPRRR